jgi:hypothetical protein
MLVYTLAKTMSTPFALKKVLKEMALSGHIQIEREIEDDPESQVLVRPRMTLN